MAQENLKPYLASISHNIASVMIGSSHTLPCCLSKPKSSLEAGKKQLRVWLQYACCVVMVLLYPSFGAPIVFLWSPYGSSEVVRYIHVVCTDVCRRYNGGLALVSRRCNGELMEMPLRYLDNLTEVYASGNVCSSVSKAVLVISFTHVHWLINLCPISGVSKQLSMSNIP